jgi:hypothetical protein
MNFRRQLLRVLPVIMLACSLLPAPVRAQFAEQGPKLVGTGAIGNAEQGHSVSLSGDGNTAIVGGPFTDRSGAAWVYMRSGGAWNQQATLVGTGIDCSGSCAERQGFSVALSADGATAIVGGVDGLSPAAWVFTLSGGVWSQQAELVGGFNSGEAFEGTPPFSVAVSRDGNTAIVGAPVGRIEFAGGGFGRGAAWVFARAGGVWSQQAILLDTSVPPNGLQGWSVSISADGDTAIVGVPWDGVAVDYPNVSPFPPPGAARVWTRAGGVWSQQAKLVGVGGDNAEQGTSVSLSSDGNTAVVGGAFDDNGVGAVWVFTRANGIWAQQGPKLVGTGAVGNAGEGTSASLSGDGNTVIVGGPSDNDDAGAAWVFTRSEGVWSQQILLGTGSAGAANQGSSVAISADASTAVVGGPSDNSDAGAAWVYSEFVFHGTPGKANCHGQRVSALARQYGGLNGAAAALGFASVSALQDAIMTYCEGSDQVASSLTLRRRGAR